MDEQHHIAVGSTRGAVKTDKMPVRPPLIFVAPYVVGRALQLACPLPQLPRWTGLLLGALLAVPAVVLYVSAQVTLHRARTTMLPEGRPRALVVTGPFGRTRNPLYLALLLLYTGVALATHAPGPLVLLPMVVVWLRYSAIKREEETLTRLFGESYVRYCQRVPRWW